MLWLSGYLGVPVSYQILKPSFSLSRCLSHAPEVLLAMDSQPHRLTCPMYWKQKEEQEHTSPSASPPDDPKPAATRKSLRSGRKSPSESNFCVLCEVEQYVEQAHEPSTKEALSPTAFVNGFIDHVAPQFKLGVQEDSHEFLRLLIDAMQKACVQARVKKEPKADKANEEKTKEDTNDQEVKDDEYPFSLFRGTVESNVICSFCKASSATLDPIEDIGLEVTIPSGSTPPVSAQSSSRNPSPIPNYTLADVQTSLQRFARTEALDADYKCERCHKVGKATKQSRLKAIPPILTLHLKRFRYGDGRVAPPRRTGRSEVSQLGDFLGKSGSSKIEGHIKFDIAFDLNPYLTEDQQKESANTMCRLFGVIVHAGKNSHSGHYIAYVRSLAKNEWWKMDDGRVTPASVNEVLGAEAYMLFYRVVNHPIAIKFEEENKRRVQEAKDRSTRKRSAYESGEDWARAKTNLSPQYLGWIRKAESVLAQEIDLGPSYFKLLSEEAAKEGASVDKGPSRIPTESDIVGISGDVLRRKLGNFFFRLAQQLTGGSSVWRDDVAVVEPEEDDTR